MKRISKHILIIIIVVLIGVIAYVYLGNAGFNQHKHAMETVTSKDGTTIAYDKSGNGRAIILIGGALASRADFDKLADLLARDYKIYSYDRRGRGDSGDTKPYDVAREIEDISALIDEAGGSVYLFGISSGACLALEATAALGDKVKKLAIYEAPYDEAKGVANQWRAYRSEVHHLLAEDRRGDAVETHMKYVGAPAAAIFAMKLLPRWQRMKALAHTIVYDIDVVGDDRSIPVARAATIKANTLVMDGGASAESMPYMRITADKLAKTIPNAQRHTLADESHDVDEKVLAPILTEFFSK